MISDADLLAAWRGGDSKAGGTLFRRHFAAVRRFFANKVDEGVEDLVQSTFEACVAGRERFEQRGSFRAYVFGIARNLVRKHWERRRVDGTKADVEEMALHELGAGVSSVAARNREHRRLLEALRRLPLKEQLVLELYFWEELSGRELGEVLLIPEDAARSRLRRAKIHLQKELRRLERFAGPLESTDEDLERWASGIRSALDQDEPAERSPRR